MANSDAVTREYLLDLMQRIPRQLADIAQDTRTVVSCARGDTDQVRRDVEQLSARLDKMEELVREFVNVATQALNLRTVWAVTQGRETPPQSPPEGGRKSDGHTIRGE